MDTPDKSNLEKYKEKYKDMLSTDGFKSEYIPDDEFPSLLPIAIKVSQRTIAQDLIFASQEEIDLVKNRITIDNRDGKIEAILNNTEFTEKKLEDDKEYKSLISKGVTPMSAPKSGGLFYLDFKYGIDPYESDLDNLTRMY